MPVQKFALKDADLLTKLTGQSCFYQGQKDRLREIALRLAQRGYGPPSVMEGPQRASKDQHHRGDR